MEKTEAEKKPAKTPEKKQKPKPLSEPADKAAPKAEAKAPAPKAAGPAEKKTEAKPAKAKAKKAEKKAEKAPKKKFIAKAKKGEVKKSAEALEAQKKLKEKKKHPTFRGRFGKKNIRKKSKTKWDKWRKPRSIDLDRGLQHGYRPKIGYGNPAELKGVHASGYAEVRVENAKDLEKIDPKTQAARIGAAVGKKKRNEIVAIANEKKIRVLN